jgi:hypothetical protein
MTRSVLAATFVAVLTLAACGAAPVEPSPSPSTGAPSASPPPSAPPADPSVSPSPSGPTPSEVPSPEPTEIALTAQEQYLLDGILRGAIDCEAIRDDLPANALAGIECDSDEPAIARIGFYLFDDDQAMLDAYVDRMTAEGVALGSGGCVDGEGENAYTPGEGMVLSRNGCFVNEAGIGNYRATLPGSHVYFGILGRTAEMAALLDFAWLGSQDTPGNPTLWGEPSH